MSGIIWVQGILRKMILKKSADDKKACKII